MSDDTILKAVSTALEESKGRDRKFTQTVDLAINLRNVDLSIPKNRIEEEIPLPHGRGKPVKVGMFASGDLAARAKGVADVVITPEQISEFAGDKKAFKKVVNDVTFFVAEAPLMPTIGKSLGVVLGPRGKMPRPVPPNADPKQFIEPLRKTIRVRSKDKPTFHTPVGAEGMAPNEIAENIDVIAHEIQRLDRVVQGFLRFVRPQDLRLAPVDVNAVLSDVARVARPEAARSGVEIVLEPGRNLPPVTADSELIAQACANLLSNGIQAMPGGGTLVLGSRRGSSGGSSASIEIPIDYQYAESGLVDDEVGEPRRPAGAPLRKQRTCRTCAQSMAAKLVTRTFKETASRPQSTPA